MAKNFSVERWCRTVIFHWFSLNDVNNVANFGRRNVTVYVEARLCFLPKECYASSSTFSSTDSISSGFRIEESI